MLLFWTKGRLLRKHSDYATGKLYEEMIPLFIEYFTYLNLLRMNKRKRFILSDKLHPQTISCVETRALPFGIDIEVGNVFNIDFSKKDISGILFQYPDTEGNIMDFTKVVENAHKFGVRIL